MSRIIIIVVAAFIVLAGGAITVMQQMEIGPFAKKVEAPKEDAKKPTAEPPRFLPMDTLNVPVFANDQVVGTVQFEIQLETTPSREKKLSEQLPRLTDAFITDLRSYLPRVLRDKNNVDTEILKKRLQIIGERTIGKGLFDQVLIVSVSQRKS